MQESFLFAFVALYFHQSNDMELHTILNRKMKENPKWLITNCEPKI